MRAPHDGRPGRNALWFDEAVTATGSVVLLHGVQSSRSTWWRVEQDLSDLGWDVHALDLLGHGSRTYAGTADLTLDDLARDVWEQVPQPVDLVVGHSLGAVVALAVARLKVNRCGRVVIEDPPGLAGSLDPRDEAANVERSVRAARDDPAGTIETLLAENRLWSRVDAEKVVESRRVLDLDTVGRFLRTNRWDLQALVAECPVPVRLLAATDNTALIDPDRTALFEALPPPDSVVISSGHSIHRDRPALWLQHVLRFADAG